MNHTFVIVLLHLLDDCMFKACGKSSQRHISTDDLVLKCLTSFLDFIKVSLHLIL